MRQIRIGDIDFVNDSIKIHGVVGKTRKHRFLTIQPALKEKLLALNLGQFPDNFYLFGSMNCPGENSFGRETMQRRWRKWVNALKIPPGHSLYSMKHTGVERYYLAGMDIKMIQQQCGHVDIEDTMKYLQRLGLHRGEVGKMRVDI